MAEAAQPPKNNTKDPSCLTCCRVPVSISVAQSLVGSSAQFLEIACQGACRVEMVHLAMKGVPVLIAVGAFVYSNWSDDEDCEQTRGILLDCGMEAADSFQITVSGSSKMHIVSEKDGSFVVPCSQRAIEDMQVNNFSGLGILGHPSNFNWTIGHCGDSSRWEQVAFCPDRIMVGDDVQDSFLDNFYDPAVVCRDGTHVEALLVFRKAGGEWRTCGSLCPKQTCLRLTSLASLDEPLDECLMENVVKNFPDVNSTSADARVLAVLHGYCARMLVAAPGVEPNVFRSFRRLVEQRDPWQGHRV